MKYIAVVLPQFYKGGVLRGIISFLQKLQCVHKKEFHFTFYILSAKEYEEEIKELENIGIETKEFSWRLIKQFHPKSYYQYKTAPDIDNNKIDYYLFFTDRIDWPLALNKPYGVVIYDYIQRYVPEIFDNLDVGSYWKLQNKFFNIAKNASNVFCTTKATYDDIINFAGVDKNKVQLLPIDYSIPSNNTNKTKIVDSKYIFWPTNSTIHKNHKNILLGLFQYWKNNKNGLSAIISGVNTHKLNPNWQKSEKDSFDHPYFESIRSLIRNCGFEDKITFIGYADEEDYHHYLRNASFMLHGNLADNGTYNVIDSTFYGVPCLVTDYPAMRYVDNYFDLDMTFMKPKDPDDICAKLLYMEENLTELKTKIETKNQHIAKVAQYDINIFLNTIASMSKDNLVSQIKSFFTHNNSHFRLSNFRNKSNDQIEYLKGFNKEGISYILYIADIKQMLSFIKAYTILLREMYIPCKLFIVGKSNDESLKLIFDILFVKESLLTKDIIAKALLVVQSDEQSLMPSLNYPESTCLKVENDSKVIANKLYDKITCSHKIEKIKQ